MFWEALSLWSSHCLPTSSGNVCFFQLPDNQLLNPEVPLCFSGVLAVASACQEVLPPFLGRAEQSAGRSLRANWGKKITGS